MNTQKHPKSKPPLYLIMGAVGILLSFLLIFLFIFLDRLEEHPALLQGGQTIDLSSFGFTLQVPESYSLSDLTEAGSSRLTVVLGNAEDSFYIYCYPNEAMDSIENVSHLDMVRYYMRSGCDQVRPRALGGRTFISYRALIKSLTGDEDWYVYETWDPDQHLIFETRMLPASMLPILSTIKFTHPLPAPAADQ